MEFKKEEYSRSLGLRVIGKEVVIGDMSLDKIIEGKCGVKLKEGWRQSLKEQLEKISFKID